MAASPFKKDFFIFCPAEKLLYTLESAYGNRLPYAYFQFTFLSNTFL